MNLAVEQITVSRTVQGNYVSGRYVPGTAQQYDAAGNIQPLSGKELQQLSEGDRERQILKIYTAFEVENGDVITRADGVHYEVQDVQDWSRFNQPHFKARLVRIEGQ